MGAITAASTNLPGDPDSSQFGNLQKLDGPTEQCQDPLPSPAADDCRDEVSACLRQPRQTHQEGHLGVREKPFR